MLDISLQGGDKVGTHSFAWVSYLVRYKIDPIKMENLQSLLVYFKDFL